MNYVTENKLKNSILLYFTYQMILITVTKETQNA